MKYLLNILQVAQDDIATAAAWYDQQRAGLGYDFVLDVEECMERIVQLPESCREVIKPFRRLVMFSFPYLIYYRLHAKNIDVVAVVHSGREPAYIASRLQ